MPQYQAKGAPFRFNGAINVENCKTSLDVMQKANLAWNVAKCEVVAKMPVLDIPNFNTTGFVHGDSLYQLVNNAYATYRTDFNIPLGLVKERYTPVQNTEAFSFFDDAIGKDKAVWQTAGFFGAGERIFVSAKLPNNILVKGDPIENYLVFSNSHDGSSGIKILFTPIRIICQNTLNAAIKHSTNYISFRHTNNVHKNLDVAREILSICKDKTEYLSECFNLLRNKRINDDDAYKMFADIILSKDEIQNVINTGHTIKQVVYRDYRVIQDSGISMRKVNAVAEMANYYFDGIGQKEILGTAYGVYNAISGYYSNIDKSEGLKRMDSILYGDKSRKIELAGNLLLAA